MTKHIKSMLHTSHSRESGNPDLLPGLFEKLQKNQCNITGGDRSDIALGAIETNAGLIIFSGNINPDPQVLSKAKEKGIPLMISPVDTFSITEQIKEIHTNIQPNEIQECIDQVENNIDWDKFPH